MTRPLDGEHWVDEAGTTWHRPAAVTTPKQLQRLMALPEVRVLRSTPTGLTELPVGARGDYWRAVLPDVRRGRVAALALRRADGAALVVFQE